MDELNPAWGTTFEFKETVVDETGNPLTSATVTLERIEDPSGAVVGAQNEAMPHTTGGVYKVTIADTRLPKANARYSFHIKIVSGSNVSRPLRYVRPLKDLT